MSLTETSYQTRRAVNWALFGVIGYIILRMVWGFLLYLYMLLFPPKPPPPNYAFGKLPALVFPAPSEAPAGQLSFALETIDGRLPEASVSAPVYLIPKKPANLLSLPTTQDFAEKFGFSREPIQETKNLYRFVDPSEPYRSLRYDIVTNNFLIRYRFEENSSVFSEKNFQPPDSIVTQTINVLQTYDLYPADLAGGTNAVTFLRYQGNTLIPASSLSRADAVRVDFFRAPVRTLRVVTPIPGEGPVVFVYSGSDDSKRKVLQFAYSLWPIDQESVATYSVKSGDVAWQELASGGGYIAQYPTTGTRVIVRNVYMALYDSFEQQTYLQPVYVFEGDNGFVGYIHAISPEWVEGAVNPAPEITPPTE